MENYRVLYEKLKEEFETYQNFAEYNIAMITEKNIKLEKNLDALANVIEMSKYINSYLSDDNLIPMINDMIIGIMGATFSSICLNEEGALIVKASNKNCGEGCSCTNTWFDELKNGEPFVINSKPPIFNCDKDKYEIHSVIGVPIQIRDRQLGYILEEHTLYNFFSYEHIKFIVSIANQIAIALENNFLYNKVKESSIRDPLLNIYNRRYFFEIVENIIKQKPKQRFAIVMADMDNFKAANDTYGHQFGDEVLIRTINIIKNNLDSQDILARYGGEEIVILIEFIGNYTTVFEKIEYIRKQIEKNTIKFGTVEMKVTASFGISFYPEDGNRIEDVLNISDSMLYLAKHTGKNLVVKSR
jgi:diguanylate cyclase (GGDEF)-like protein